MQSINKERHASQQRMDRSPHCNRRSMQLHPEGSRRRPAPARRHRSGFSLPSQEDAQVTLSQFKGKWVVLYFYPRT